MNNLRERIRMSLAITRKDIADTLTNRGFLVGFLLPPFLSILFMMIFINDYNDTGIKIAVYDPSQSELVEILRNNPSIELIEATSVDHVQQIIEDDAAAGLVILAGFDAAVEAGDQPTLSLYVSREESDGTQRAINSLIEETLREQAGQTLPAEITLIPIGMESSPLTSGNLSLQHFFMITLIVLSIVSIGVNAVPNMLIEEKERHTLDVILVSPAAPSDVVMGKALVGMLFAGINVTLLAVMNRGWVGQWWLSILLLGLTMLALILLGLLLGTLFNRQTTMNMWGTILVMLLLIPTWFVGRGPELIRIFAHGLPTFYLIHGLQQTLIGEATLASIGTDVLALAIAVLILFAIVVWTQSRQESV